MRLASLALIVLLAATPVTAKPLTISTGETWIFSIANGQPANARKVDASSKPARGEVKVTVFSLMGTTMTASSNIPDAYTFRAELIGAGGRRAPVRTCTLPPRGRPVLETWPQKAKAVRVGDFKPAADPGAC
jgi:hypothetical protein